MDRLWGEFAAVPQSNVVSLAGGERVEAGGRVFDVAYTPGHASHHVSYFDRVERRGLRRRRRRRLRATEGTCCRPRRRRTSISRCGATSVDRIDAWSPSTLFLTHFGPVTRPAAPGRAARQPARHRGRGARVARRTEGTDEEKSRAVRRVAASGTAPPHERRAGRLRTSVARRFEIPLVRAGAILEEAARCSVAAGLTDPPPDRSVRQRQRLAVASGRDLGLRFDQQAQRVAARRAG